MKPVFLSTKNHHPHDDRISFEEESHTYTIDGDSSFTSVTTFVHHFFPKFEAEKTAISLLAEKRITNGRTVENNCKYRKDAIHHIQETLNVSLENATAILNDTNSFEYKRELENILQKWKDNSTLGTQTHADIESFYNEEEVINDTPEYQYFIKFNEDFKKEYPQYRPYRTEWTVFYKDLKLAGSIDMVYENMEDGTLMIYDWKRVKSIEYDSMFKNQTSLSEHLEGVPNTNFWHYSLQLNTYKGIIENQYCKKVTKLVLVRLYPEAPTYELHECADLQNEVKALFEDRLREVNSQG